MREGGYSRGMVVMDVRLRVIKCITVARGSVFKLVFRSELSFATTGFESWKDLDNKPSATDCLMQHWLRRGIGWQQA